MKKIMVIGGGIAGLSAGIFARMNGFECTILEKNQAAGGECIGWDRNGYHIDGCIHWLVGTKEGTAINQLWQTVGALDGVEIYHPDRFINIETDGVTVPFWRDLDQLQSSWLALSPQDQDVICDFCQIIRRLQSFEVPVDKPMDMMSIPEKLKMFSAMKEAGTVMRKYGKVALTDYALRFRSPAIREALSTFLPPGYSASSVFFALASFSKGQASIPRGGSKVFSERMAKRFLDLGGQLKTGCEVVNLQIMNGYVRQVICKNGDTFTADYVIAACDAHLLYHKLLEGKYNDKAFERRFQNAQDYPLASQVLVALGYTGTIDDLPRSYSFQTEPEIVGQRAVSRLNMTHYQHEPAFSPKGHTLITCSINQFKDDYDAWQKLAEDKQMYREEKKRIGRFVRQAIEQRFPDMAGRLIVLDVASPKTYERYCNAYRGAFMGFLPTTGGKMMAHNGRIRGLKNMHLSGQWLQPPGGLPVAVITGKDTIRRICRQEKRRFNDA